jgi:hypothetical protein
MVATEWETSLNTLRFRHKRRAFSWLRHHLTRAATTVSHGPLPCTTGQLLPLPYEPLVPPSASRTSPNCPFPFALRRRASVAPMQRIPEACGFMGHRTSDGEVLTDKTRIHLRFTSVRIYTFFTTGIP